MTTMMMIMIIYQEQYLNRLALSCYRKARSLIVVVRVCGRIDRAYMQNFNDDDDDSDLNRIVT